MSYRKWMVIAALIFISGLMLGFVTPTEATPGELKPLEELAELLAPLPQPVLFMAILVNNLFALVFSFILSPLLGLVPVLALAANGWVLAVVARAVVQEESIGFLLAGILPHGILEIPALIIGQAAALSFGTMAVTALLQKERRAQLLPNLKQNSRYLGYALLLLVPAAIIETYVTPLLLDRLI